MAEEKKKSLTVFKSDRHEDMAAIYAVALIVIFVLCYQAFVAPRDPFKQASENDGKVLSVKAKAGEQIKSGDPLLELEIMHKDASTGQTSTEKIVIPAHMTGKLEYYLPENVSAPSDGKVVEVLVKEKDAVKKGDKLMIVESEKKDAAGAVTTEKVEVKAKNNGVVKKISKKAGDAVKAKDAMMQLVVVSPEDAPRSVKKKDTLALITPAEGVLP
jgi:biotin carboxyl carrier protein